MELTNFAEEILETLWIHIQEKNIIPDTTLFKDQPAFTELINNGYISLDKEDLLTEKGYQEAALCVRRHRLAERLLSDVLHIRGHEVHETGCKLEHILKKGLEDNICILLGHPSTCPHGKPIPPGKCCETGKSKTDSYVLPLSKLKKGNEGKIAYIQTEDKEMLRKIMAIGAIPGSLISLVQRFPTFVFQIGNSQFAVDKTVADHIKIWLH